MTYDFDDVSDYLIRRYLGVFDYQLLGRFWNAVRVLEIPLKVMVAHAVSERPGGHPLPLRLRGPVWSIDSVLSGR